MAYFFLCTNEVAASAARVGAGQRRTRRAKTRTLLQGIDFPVEAGKIDHFTGEHGGRLNRAPESGSPQHFAACHLKGDKARRLDTNSSLAKDRRRSYDLAR